LSRGVTPGLIQTSDISRRQANRNVSQNSGFLISYRDTDFL
jgi:hypothetical protein